MKHKTSLRTLREAKGISQQSMANKLGYTLTSYNKIELGHRRMSVNRAMKAAEILECSLDEIFLPINFPKRTNENGCCDQ